MSESNRVPDEAPLRKRWMSACARSPISELKDIIQELDTGITFDVLRPAKPGLVMVRGRAGGSGQLFNTGEMTVTRCSVRSAQGIVGHGYVAGRDEKHAEIAARMDVLFQAMDEDRALPFIEKLEQQIASRVRKRQQQSAPTRVEFFTMVRGEDT